MSTPVRIVYCDCAYVEAVPRAVRDKMLGTLCAAGAEFESVPDLCELAARRDPRLKAWASGGPLCIVACYPRAVRWLFAAAGAPLPDEGVEVLNMRELSAPDIARSLLGDGPADLEPDVAKAQAVRTQMADQQGEWIPWFPVIDRSRCKDCGKCLDFCLFGAFGKSADGRVEVQHPENCKTWCPACARVCPEVAIMFPKHKASPVNGGEVTEADERREKVAVDPSALLKGDVYATLRARTRGPRFAANRSPEQSRADRLRRLAELRETLDIPPEVIEGVMAERGGGPATDDEQGGECERSD